MKIPMWMYLGWLRIYAQFKCGRCHFTEDETDQCVWCRQIKDLEVKP